MKKTNQTELLMGILNGVGMEVSASDVIRATRGCVDFRDAGEHLFGAVYNDIRSSFLLSSHPERMTIRDSAMDALRSAHVRFEDEARRLDR